VGLNFIPTNQRGKLRADLTVRACNGCW